jgi:hypothetical protein
LGVLDGFEKKLLGLFCGALLFEILAAPPVTFWMGGLLF